MARALFRIATAALTLMATAPVAAHAQSVEESLAKAVDTAKTVLNHQDGLARATGAMAICTVAVGAPDTAIAALKDAGWSGDKDDEGDIAFDYQGNDETVVTIDPKGGYCIVETSAAGTSDAAKNFFDVTDALNWPPYDWNDDGDLGCYKLALDPGLQVAISGPGDACKSDTDAVLEFFVE